MKLFEKKDSVINIEEDDLQDAKLSSLDFADKTTRKRAFLNVLGARLAMKMLFSQKIEVTNLYSLYTIHNVIEELDIADIYYQGIKIDVRVVFNKEEIFIPKSHFELDLLPDLYCVLDLAQDFSCVEFIGFFEPKTLNTQNENKDFYFYECDRLQDPKTLKMFLHDFKGDGSFKAPVNLENAEALFVSLVDKEISQRDKVALFQCLAGDITLREKIVEFENFETLSKEAAKDDDLMQDGVFDIIGAQQIHNDEELLLTEEKTEVIGEVLTDMLEVEDEEKIELNHADLEDILSEVEAEHEASGNNNLGAFAAGAAAGAIVDGVAAGGAAATAAMGAAGAGMENNLFEALPDLDLDLNFGGDSDGSSNGINLAEDASDLMVDLEENNKYETIDNKDDLLNELSKMENMEDFEETIEIEDDSAIQAKFFGGLEDEGIGNREQGTVTSEEERVKSKEQAKAKTEEENSSTDDEADLDDNDLNMINETVVRDEASDYEEEPFDKDVIPLDQISTDGVVIPANYDRVFKGGDDETLERLRKLEEDEDGVNHDEVLSQVDEFLKDADLSASMAEISSAGLDIDNSSLLNTPIETQTSPPEPEASYSSDVQNHTQETEEYFSDSETGLSNEQIKLLFKEEKTDAIPDLNISANNLSPDEGKKPTGLKDKKMLIAASVAGVILVSYLISQRGMPNNNGTALPPANAPIAAQGQAPASPNANNTTSAESGANAQPASEEQAADTGSDPLLQPAPPAQGNVQANVNKDMNKAVSDAFLSEPVSASVSKIAWEVPEDLAYNDGFRKYLQMAGKNLKLNLQNNLLLATEMAYSNKVVVDLTIGKDGSVQSSDIVKSSGSKQIDKIVLQSVKDTLTYLKIPASEVSGNSVDATLIINF